MERTRAALAEHARALTAERGLAGFTVEELCERVGISRRTFFNYFPTKEDAVLGHHPDRMTEEQEAAFIARGIHDGDGISPTLLTDLARLVIEQMKRTDFTREHLQQHREIVRREPQLLARILHAGENHQREFANLIARREGLAPDDPFPRVAVLVIVDITKHTVGEYFADDNRTPFARLLERNLRLAQRLLGQHLELTEPTGRP